MIGLILYLVLIYCSFWVTAIVTEDLEKGCMALSIVIIVSGVFTFIIWPLLGVLGYVP